VTYWKQRFEDIGAWERHLTREGMRAVKLFLHICNSEQRRRLLERAQHPRQALEVLLRRRREQPTGRLPARLRGDAALDEHGRRAAVRVSRPTTVALQSQAMTRYATSTTAGVER
jgi:hypothetical protein